MDHTAVKATEERVGWGQAGHRVQQQAAWYGGHLAGGGNQERQQGTPIRGESELLFNKPLHRAGKYNMFMIIF